MLVAFRPHRLALWEPLLTYSNFHLFIGWWLLGFEQIIVFSLGKLVTVLYIVSTGPWFFVTGIQEIPTGSWAARDGRFRFFSFLSDLL